MSSTLALGDTSASSAGSSRSTAASFVCAAASELDSAPTIAITKALVILASPFGSWLSPTYQPRRQHPIARGPLHAGAAGMLLLIGSVAGAGRNERRNAPWEEVDAQSTFDRCARAGGIARHIARTGVRRGTRA